MKFTKWTAKVWGVVWQGHRASTEYEFNHLPTRADVLARSGDFQHVTRIEATKTQTLVVRESRG